MNGEELRVVFENEKIRVESITSNGAASPDGFWYDSGQDEWVSVTEGSAVLEFVKGEVRLNTGDNYFLKAHVKHRVKCCSRDCRWLCVYLKG